MLGRARLTDDAAVLALQGGAGRAGGAAGAAPAAGQGGAGALGARRGRAARQGGTGTRALARALREQRQHSEHGRQHSLGPRCGTAKQRAHPSNINFEKSKFCQTGNLNLSYYP